MKYLVACFFLSGWCLTSFAQVSGNIVVYPDSDNIPISKFVFGSGDEMISCFSPLAETQPLILATQPSLLRFGGIGAEYLDWEDASLSGIFYIDFLDTFLLPDSVKFGVDSFLRLCEYIGAEPILTVNMQTGDTGLARRMVEYTNGDTTTPLGLLRAQRGHPQPYNVSIWSLGNEPDIAGGQWPVPPWGYWTFYRHFGIPFANWSWQDSSFWTPQDFAGLIPLYVNAMEGASPIPLEFVYSIAGDLSWLRPVLEPYGNLIDYLDVHYYASSAWDSIADTTDYIEWLSKTDTIFPCEVVVQVYRDSLAALGMSHIELVVLEYNSGIIMVPDPLWWNYLTGLFIAVAIGHWMHAGLHMAAVYSIHEGNPANPSDYPYFGVIRGDSVSRRMPSYVLELYNEYFGDTLMYSYSDHKNSGYGIECWASKRSGDGMYPVVVINKTLDTTYAMTLSIPEPIVHCEVRTITNNAPLNAPYNGSTGIEYAGVVYPDSFTGGWSYMTRTFEPASISLLEIFPYTAISEDDQKARNIPVYPTMVRSGMEISVPTGDHVLYSVDGRRIVEWKDRESVVVPVVP
ncbi:hypothetical protein JXB22_00660, partial [candidate division WOR-3 bacterium]|nr:hypothetical protein [candidate division WOR-3 bacterium]